MKNRKQDQTDHLIKTERRGIWFALIVVLVLTAALVAASETRRALLTVVVPIGIAFGAIWVARGSRGVAAKAGPEHRKLVTHDELRLAAISRAYKWAFFLMLGELTAFCLVSVTAAVHLPGQMVAALAVASGAFAFLASFLVFDRA
ncbi:MAG: hypothetical protein PF483_04250 [Halothiobacillus sp.]|nr:hypothetical protein [Halothiobacillus sp.]